MAVQLNHTIVWCRDKDKSSRFLTDLLGLPAARPFGPMMVVQLSNDVSLDFYDQDGQIAAQHYAFLLSEDEFDQVLARIQERHIQYWADPGRHRSGQINHGDGGRGLYFEDPDRHLLEILTRPYGG